MAPGPDDRRELPEPAGIVPGDRGAVAGSRGQIVHVVRPRGGETRPVEGQVREALGHRVVLTEHRHGERLPRSGRRDVDPPPAEKAGERPAPGERRGGVPEHDEPEPAADGPLERVDGPVAEEPHRGVAEEHDPGVGGRFRCDQHGAGRLEDPPRGIGPGPDRARCADADGLARERRRSRRKQVEETKGQVQQGSVHEPTVHRKRRGRFGRRQPHCDFFALLLIVFDRPDTIRLRPHAEGRRTVGRSRPASEHC